MLPSDLHVLPTPYLQKRKKLNRFALFTVWAGAGVAILASFYQLTVAAAFPVETFVTSLVALAASVPVFMEKRRIEEVLLERAR